MKILASVGARATVLTAAAALTLAAPAAADATAYLMYLKGSEGPPAVPMRVVWDARDDANGRVTIDLGDKYEPALTKLGLPRVLEYDATRDKSQFSVRKPRSRGVGATRRRQGSHRCAPDHACARAIGADCAALRHLSRPAKVWTAEGSGSDQGRHHFCRPAGTHGTRRGRTAGQAVSGGIHRVRR